MDQVWSFYAAANENRKREILDLAISVRAAFGADKKEWMKYVDMLKPKSKKIHALERISPEEKIQTLKEMLSGR